MNRYIYIYIIEYQNRSDKSKTQLKICGKKAKDSSRGTSEQVLKLSERVRWLEKNNPKKKDIHFRFEFITSMYV